jgi:hypothetical protein
LGKTRFARFPHHQDNAPGVKSEDFEYQTHATNTIK